MKLFKKMFRNWLGLDDYVRYDSLKGQLETRVDYTQVLDKKVSNEIIDLFSGKTTNYYFEHEEKNRVIATVTEIVKNTAQKDWQECDEKYRKSFESYIQSEEFIDRVVARINRKQVGQLNG